MKPLLGGGALGLLVLSVWHLLGAQQPTPALDCDQKVEYYRQGAALQYKQLLAANQRIAELEARIESDRLEKEAATALREMAEWRRRVLGDARCTIEEPDAKVTCPLGVISPADSAANLPGDANQQEVHPGSNAARPGPGDAQPPEAGKRRRATPR